MADPKISNAATDPERRLRRFVEGLQDYGLFVLDPAGLIASWNAGAETITGYRADEIIGQHFSRFYLAEDIATGKPGFALAEATRSGRFEDIGLRVRKDGSRYWANAVFSALRDEHGALIGFGKITRDISSRVDAEERLTASEARFKNLVDTVLDTVVDGLVTINKDGMIRSFNKAAIRLFGYRADEVLGKNVSMLMPEPYHSVHDSYISAYRTTGVAKIIGKGREVVGRRKDGTTFPMELAVGETVGGGEHAFVGIVRDLTERREAENARDQLRQSQKMESLGQLTGGIAHDFNNLLAVIIGNLDLLREQTKEGDEMQYHIDASMRAALRGSELTQRLLAFGRRQALHPKLASINELVAHFTALLQRTLGEHIEIVTAFAPELWSVKVDPGQFEDALLNLAVNARDAMPDGGKLIIETANVHLDEEYAAHNAEVVAGDYAMIAVSDTGTGMTQEVVARAFEPFFTTKQVGKGSGLGLSMVYGFVKQSAGHVKIYSEIGKGTSIKIFLPRTEGSEPSLPIAAGAGIRRPAPNSKLVLVVEDDRDVLALTAAMVESLGYRVVTAGSGDAALAILERQPEIEALLTDVMLPGSLNGPALAKRATALRPALKVLFTSGYAEHAIVQSGVLQENGNLISKPFRKQQLAERLADLLGH